MQLLGGPAPVVPRVAEKETSRGSGGGVRVSTLRRIGVSARTSVGVYTTEEPAGDHLGLLLPDPPTLLPDEEEDG